MKDRDVNPSYIEHTYKNKEKCSTFWQSRIVKSGPPATPGSQRAMISSRFCVAKRKTGEKREKQRVSKRILLKGCHRGQNVTVLTILERLEFKNFSCRPTMVADNTFQYYRPFHFEIHFTDPENHTCLHSQFKIAKHWRSARITFQKKKQICLFQVSFILFSES